MVNPTGIKGGLLSTKISVGTKSVCPLFSSSSCVHKGSGYRPRKTELNGQMSEVGRSKIYRDTQKLYVRKHMQKPNGQIHGYTQAMQPVGIIWWFNGS